MANQNIGHIKCPLSGRLAVVRADKRGKLYYFSPFGKITPNLPEGQSWLRQNAVLWPNEQQPPNIELKTIINGLPPVVTITEQNEVNAPEPEQKPPEKALTDESASKRNEKPRKKSALEWLMGDEDE